MQKFLTIIDDFYNVTPDIVVHAPFCDARNITPFANFDPKMEYDLRECTGKNTAFFATHDKTETLGLLADIITAKPLSLTIVWPKDWGGKGLNKHLTALNLEAHYEIKAHARLAYVTDFTNLNHDTLKDWLKRSEPQLVKNSDLIAQAGLFSWRNIDPASALLIEHLPADIAGHGADFGAGWGYLSRAVLNLEKVKTLSAIELDIRGINCTKNNINDPKLTLIWSDVTHFQSDRLYDFIVMNPPFHANGSEDHSLGQTFIEQAHKNLRKGGHLYMVANRHLPYEFALKKLYKSFDIILDAQGYKIISAKK